MKKTARMILALVLISLCASALAETWYVKTPNGKTVNMRDDRTGQVIGHIPYGTAVVSDDGESTELAAYVTYKGVSGYV